MSATDPDIISVTRFAERVERLCKHLRERMEHGPDRNAIEDLETEAADLATRVKVPLDEALAGIAEAIGRS